MLSSNLPKINNYTVGKSAYFFLLLILVLGIVAATAKQAAARPEASPPQMAGGLNFLATFTPDTIAPNGVSTLLFTIQNITNSPHSAVTFTNTLPAGVIITSPSLVSTSCNGKLSAPDGGTEILFHSGRIGGGKFCTIEVNVTSSVPGTHVNTTSLIDSDMGQSPGATANLTVDPNRPTFSMAFSPAKILPNGTTKLTYLIDNSNVGSNVNGFSFSHSLPDGLVVASPTNGATDCRSYGFPTFNFPAPVYTNAGANSFSFSGSLLAGATCTVSIDITAQKGDFYQTKTSNFVDFSASSGAAVATLDASTQTFAKTFVNDPVRPGEEAIVQFSISNSHRGTLSSISFTDDLNGALAGLAATGLPLNDVCGSGSTLTGSSLLTLTGGNLASGENCTFEVVLSVPAGAAVGSFPSTTSNLTGQLDNAPITADSATDTLDIEPSPQISKRFLSPTVQSGAEIVAEFTITNTSPTATATDISFEDDLSAFIEGTITSALPGSNFCGTGSSISAFVSVFLDPDNRQNPTILQMSGGTLAPSSSCTFQVTLQLQDNILAGPYTNTVDSLSAVIDTVTYFGQPSSASIAVVKPPAFSAKFVNDPVLPGDTTKLVYTISHAGSDDVSPATAATNISFTHDLNGGLAGLTTIGLPITDGCGAGSQLSGTSIISFTDGELLGGTNCTMTVTVQVPSNAAVGTYPIPTSELLSTYTGQPLTSPLSTPELDISILTFSKRFVPATALPGELVTLEYTIINESPTVSADIIQFSDYLYNAMPNLTALGGTLTNSCGSTVSGTSSLTISGGTLAPNTSCTISLNVQIPNGASDGEYVSPTTILFASVNGTPSIIDPAVAILKIDTERLAFEKAFSSDSNLPGVTSSLVYTITNIDRANAVNSLEFTDDLDAVLSGLQATGLPMNNGCGAGSQLSGTSLLQFTNGSIPAGGTCTFTVAVNVPFAANSGSYPSASSDITGAINGATVGGGNASGTLNVGQLNASHQFDSTGAPNTIVPLTFMLTNPDAVATDAGFGFANHLDGTLAGLTAVNLPATDVCGPGSMLSGGPTLTLTNGSLRQFGFCTFTVDVMLPKDVPLDSYINRLDGLTQNGGFVSLPVSTTLNIIRPEVSLATITPITEILPGQPVSYTLTVSNSGAGTATDIALPAVNPADFDVTSIVNSNIPFTQTTNSGIVALNADQILTGAETTVQINATVSPTINSDQTITHTVSVTATADVLTTNNDQTLVFNLSVPKVQLDTDSLVVFEEDGSAMLTVTLDSPNPYAPVTVGYQTADGTATSPSDYTGVTTGTVTIPAGESSATLTIPIIDDTFLEEAEAFTVSLTSALGGQLTGTLSAQISITDTDVPGVNLTSTIPVTTVLPGQPVSYTLTLANSGSGTATGIRLVDGLSAELLVTDIITNGMPMTITSTAGQTLFEIDAIDPNGTVTVQINGVVSNTLSSDQIISHTATITSTAGAPINDRDATVAFNLVVPKVGFDSKSQAITVREEAGTASVTISLDKANPYAPVTIGYHTADRSAVAGSDYTGITGTLIIPAGGISGTISIPILDDELSEDIETFSFNLTEVTGGSVAANSSLRVTIQDDIYKAYLPITFNRYANGPDLVVDRIDLSGSTLSVVIKNEGDRPVIGPFWVDLIVNPANPPTQVNDTAERLRADGLVWGVQGSAVPLEVGESLTLTVDSPYFRSDFSTVTGSIPAGSTVYAHVDSASTNTNHGSIEESHELSGTPYNNIGSATASAEVDLGIPEAIKKDNSRHMPSRP